MMDISLVACFQYNRFDKSTMNLLLCTTCKSHSNIRIIASLSPCISEDGYIFFFQSTHVISTRALSDRAHPFSIFIIQWDYCMAVSR